MCEAPIEKIVIVADGAVRPACELPIGDNDEGPALDGPALTNQRAVRALPTAVDRSWQNKNRVFPVQGPDVTVAAVRRRASARR
jgi:hypothetical protein